MVERIGLAGAALIDMQRLSLANRNTATGSERSGKTSQTASGDNEADSASKPSSVAALHRGDDTASQTNRLSEEEKKQVAELKDADRTVRQHEMAHQTAGAGLITRGAQYEYKRGPDGQLYAVGGDVQIDSSPVPDDPQATIAKMERVKRAAMAPAEPSTQDRRVASEAATREMQARLELAQQPEPKSNGDAGSKASTASTIPGYGDEQRNPAASIVDTMA